ncbi:hypothetical protein J691_4063 [Acinetobacter baumannii 981176]|nr:hypothetical protein J691_4063 [Acinetobacter baumannii 981176]
MAIRHKAKMCRLTAFAYIELNVERKHPANTALPSGPISLNLVPT